MAHFFCALKVAAFDDTGRFKRRIDQIIRQIHESGRAESVDRIYVPGEIEAETERRYRLDGIPLSAASLGALADTAKRLGVDVSLTTPSAQAG